MIAKLKIVASIGSRLSETCQNIGVKHLLIIEDHPDLVRSLYEYFEPRGYVLDSAPDGRIGLALATDNQYDVIILDWNLPRMDGLEFLQRYQDDGGRAPVLLLTARDDIEDKVLAFRTGARDYLTKPFALPELEVRIEALLGSSKRHGASKVLAVGDLEYDTGTHVVRRAGTELHLYPACRKLLECLMKASPEAVSKETLERQLWGEDPPDADRLRSHIYDLRKTIDAPFDDKLLHTLPRLGYRLAIDSENDA